MTDNREVLTRPAPRPDLTLSYGSHPDHVADVWLPPGATAHDGGPPVVLMIHGGYWRAAIDRTHLGPFASEIAALGHVVICPEYRRTGGGGGWPATFTDVAAAVDALPGLLHGVLCGRASTDRVILMGHSAGGHLAVWATQRRRLPAGAPGALHAAVAVPGHRPGPGALRMAGVVALAPVIDLADAYRRGLDDDATGALLGGGPQDVPGRYAVTDPAALGTPRVRTVIVHGDRDGRVPLDMSRTYAAATGTPLVVAPGADHFALIDPLSAAWPYVLTALATVRPR
ncbi:MAG: alpha/beta hydrolase fold domain-containing protein [Streptosporangiales bacterium]|nr:alpha/beta hydrolase fold domain-containing protein [Streptosporangiales bacterium]